MNNGLNRVRLQRGCDGVGVAYIGLDDGYVLAGEALQALRHVALRIGEIIEDDHLMPALYQHGGGVGADIAGAAGQQYAHGIRPW